MSIYKRDKPVPQIVVDAGNDLERLKSALRHPDVDVRGAAAWMLGLIGRYECLQPLINALKDPDEEVRAESARALGVIKELPNINRKLGAFEDTPDDIWAMNELMKALKDKDYHVRAAAGTALLSYGKNVEVPPAPPGTPKQPPPTISPPTVPYRTPAIPPSPIGVPILESSKSVPNSAVKKIYPPIKRNKPIPQIVLDAGFNLDKLRDLARHRDPSVREAAVFVLGHMGEPEGVPIITSCAADPDNFVRESAARALGTIEYPFDSKEATGRMEDMREDRTAAAALLKLLKDREVNIRTAAAAALGNYGRQDVAKALLALAHDQSSSIRAAVATGLGGCPYTDVQAALIRMLQDDDFWTRLCAVRSLSRLLDPASLVPLLALLNDPNASVRANVARGLIEFHKAGLGTPSFWQLAGDSLLALTSSDTSEEVIGFAQEALLRISPKK